MSITSDIPNSDMPMMGEAQLSKENDESSQ